MDNINQFYLDQPEPNKGCLLALRKIILDQSEDITETRKYGMPCFCYKGKMFCYLWTDKVTNMPYILMVEGNRLNFEVLESGNRKRMKTLSINPNEDLPIEVIHLVLNEALDLYRNGVIKIK